MSPVGKVWLPRLQDPPHKTCEGVLAESEADKDRSEQWASCWTTFVPGHHQSFQINTSETPLRACPRCVNRMRTFDDVTACQQRCHNNGVTRMRLTPTGSHNKAWGRRGNGAPQVNVPKMSRTPTGFHNARIIRVRRSHTTFVDRPHAPMWNPVGVRIDAGQPPGVRRDAETPGFVVEIVPG